MMNRQPSTTSDVRAVRKSLTSPLAKLSTAFTDSHPSSRDRASPTVRPLVATSFDSRVAPAVLNSDIALKAIILSKVLQKIQQRRKSYFFNKWRYAVVGGSEDRIPAFQRLMESKVRRICFRYGRDKLYAIFTNRRRIHLRTAFERWKSAAIVVYANEILERSRLQVQVALDQTRAERGVYERAELRSLNEKRLLALKYAFLRWKDMKDIRAINVEAASLYEAAHRVTQAGLHLQSRLTGGKVDEPSAFRSQLLWLLKT